MGNNTHIYGEYESSIVYDAPRINAHVVWPYDIPAFGAVFFRALSYVHRLQGYDSACMAVYLATGRNSSTTLSVFSKWAACTGLFMFHRTEGGGEAACEKVGLIMESISYISLESETVPPLPKVTARHELEFVSYVSRRPAGRVLN